MYASWRPGLCERRTIEGVAAPLPIGNLDTDQIMPKQFLRGIDKAGLDQGLLYDLRFDAAREPRSDCVLNRAEYAGCRVLIGGENFGCGSSREHAVWGLCSMESGRSWLPASARYSIPTAMNNLLLLATVPQAAVDNLLLDVANPLTNWVSIDIRDRTIRSRNHHAQFQPFTQTPPAVC